MRRDGWHILREPGALTLARRLPPRFDLCAEAAFPPADPLRLAWQVRQDLWRALRKLRGFSPVVRVWAEGAGLRLAAGGRVEGRAPRMAEGVIAALLADPAKRRRWIAFAGAGRPC